MVAQGQTVGYARVSSADQNIARQLETIGAVDQLFTEQVSAAAASPRPKLQECLEYCRAGDTLRVASMDRLARSVLDLQRIVDALVSKGVRVVFLKEGQTYSADQDDSMGRLMLQILGAVAEFERNLIRERQAEGIKLAKAAGKYKGRAVKLSPAQVSEARERVDAGVPKSKVARELRVSRSTLYRALVKD